MKTIKVFAAALFVITLIFSNSVRLQADQLNRADKDRQDPKVELGKLLFFDKILGGNKNVSCATCHHPLCSTGDGLSLPVGQGGRGLGMTRDNGAGPSAVRERVPRNAPSVFNLGLATFTTMFWDGRVQVDSSFSSGFNSPAGNNLPSGLINVLAVQAMFPVQSSPEMAGYPGENEIADASAQGKLAGKGGAWDLLANRLRQIPAYVNLFIKAFPHVHAAGDITFVDAANAIAAFEAQMGQAQDSPYDHYLRHEEGAMSQEAQAGMALFYGSAGCSNCHQGTLQTDMKFHSIAMPQIGPGKGDGPSKHEDYGRERVTNDPADLYRFRTPSLRNVITTGPWGHDGAYNTLDAMIRHLTNPAHYLEVYNTNQAVLPSRSDLDAIDFQVQQDRKIRAAIAASSEIKRIDLSHEEIFSLIEFLRALSDPRCLDLRKFVPEEVPSGLPVRD